MAATRKAASAKTAPAAAPSPRSRKPGALKPIAAALHDKAGAAEAAAAASPLAAASSPDASPVTSPIPTAPTARAAGEDKAKKPKLVRDSFTSPKAEYAAIDALQLRAAKLGQPAKKSEVVRAGIKALLALSDEALLASLAAVPRVKTGRPAKD
jgi:hypothetical protein